MRVQARCETCGVKMEYDEQSSAGARSYDPPNCPNGHSLFPSDLSRVGPKVAPLEVLEADKWDEVQGEYFSFTVKGEEGKRFCHYTYYQEEFTQSPSCLYFYIGNATGCKVPHSGVLDFESARKLAFEHLTASLFPIELSFGRSGTGSPVEIRVPLFKMEKGPIKVADPGDGQW